VEPKEGVPGGVASVVVAAVVAIALMLAAPVTAVASNGSAARGAQGAQFTASGSVKQVYVTGAKPGQKLKLVDRGGNLVQTQRAGSLGGGLFRRVEPGGGYRVLRPNGEQSPRLRVLTGRPEPPDPSVYDQDPEPGYGYLKTRDGTELAVNVQLPGPVDKGPYPTLLEYSGYGYADPSGGESSIAPIAKLLGFAVVDVNMRGTGCSGGAFDYFERLQSLDGYDVIETVARQRWVLNGQVGMMGISYGGISQLFVGATRPPHLAAIAPLSVIDNTQTTLYPGGILNTGFALQWAEDRVHDALPASPTGGQEWAYERIQEGDEVCEANQDLHTEAVNLIERIRRNNYYRPRVADPVSPTTFVHKIDVPVFLACQWTDEQTGGHCPALPSHFTGTDRKWFTFVNGAHIDSLDPRTFNRWYDFLELYVAEQRPELTGSQRGIAPAIYASVMGVPGVHLPRDPIQEKADYDTALAAFEAQPSVRILFDNGAGGDMPGAPLEAFRRSFASFPPPKTQARSWFLGNDGALKPGRRHEPGVEVFSWDPSARPPTDFTGDTGSGPGGLWTATPDYDWAQGRSWHTLSYLSSPMRSDTAIIGGGALKAWIKAAAPNVDLQVTVSEVRPDGKETFIQSGWLRTSGRKLDSDKSTLLEPVPSFRESDAAPLPRGEWAKVTVPLYYQGHVYREGSRLRVTISAPGGDQPIWAFDEAQPEDPVLVKLAHSREMPSRIVLPVVPGVSAPTGLPPCPGLRGQPCRDYKPLANHERELP
jgi:predicted acyl esterase